MAYKNIANGAQDVAKNVLAEVRKRVPPNQLEQFMNFRDKNAKFKRRVNKYPQRLPPIDWDYYRSNVRSEYVKMVDDFEKKYEELNKVYDSRGSLDTSKYYVELEKQRADVQSEVNKYIAKSNERIKSLEKEIERIKSLKEYNHMTFEEFICMRPECATYIPYGGKPLFWPHTPEEQKPGAVGVQKVNMGHDDDPKTGFGSKDKKGDKKDETVAKNTKDSRKKEDKTQSHQTPTDENFVVSFLVKETDKEAKASFGCGFLSAEQANKTPKQGICVAPNDPKTKNPCDFAKTKASSVFPNEASKQSKPKASCYKTATPDDPKDAKTQDTCDKKAAAATRPPKDAKQKDSCGTKVTPKDQKACDKKAATPSGGTKCGTDKDACAELKKKTEEDKSKNASKFDPCGIISKVSKGIAEGLKGAKGDKEISKDQADIKDAKHDGGKKKK